ncbi:MAG: WecB/TagA/CpsF family glycosyltransferase [Pseudoalteromonas sp.]|nr:WecB/TagA/CpsF family glycosyltransferase [Pseudoalteromonas sp.]
MTNKDRFTLFGIEIWNVNIREVVRLIKRSSERGIALSIATPNIDHFVRINKNSSILCVYQSLSCCVNDSRILSLLCKLLFGIKIHTVTGSDLTYILFKSKWIRDKTITVVGSSRVEVDKLIERFNLNANNVKNYVPKKNFILENDEIEKCVNVVARNKSDIVFLAVGSPQQEIVASKLQCNDIASVVLCIGASIDYLTGKEKRAPKIFQYFYLEWLFRFLQSPIRRFKRYFVNCPQIIYYLLKNK